MNQISLNIPKIDKRTALIEVLKHIPLRAVENVSDTVVFQLPEIFRINSDTTSAPSILMETKLFYTSGGVAKKIKFDSESAEWMMRYVWWPLPKDIYFTLHEASKQNKLPKEWQRFELNFRGEIYDCYYSPPDILLKIDYSGEVIKVSRIDEEREDQEVKLGKYMTFQDYRFVPNVRIQDRFIDLYKRGGRFVYEQRENDRVISGEFTIWYEQGYEYISYLKLK